MQETVHNDPAVNWLLQSDDPSIRYLTLTEVLGKSQDSPEVESAGKQIPQGPKVQLLLSGQMTDGGFGVHPYQKWRCPLETSLSRRTRNPLRVQARCQGN